MEQQSVATGKFGTTIMGMLVFLGLYLTSLYSYLLFHSLAEIFSIVVAICIFMVAWNSRPFLDNNYLLVIGIAYLFVGGVDLLHTLAYAGMGVFKGHGTDLPTQLWISARYLESISLLAAPLFLGRRLAIGPLLICYASAVGLLLGAVFFWNIFPSCFIEGTGLTSFKKISEYVICVIFLGAILTLTRRRSDFEPLVFKRIIASIMVTIAAELAFTFYVHAYGISNLIGHYFKVISFYLIYKAMIETGLSKPYTLLFRNLKQSEEALRKERDRAQSYLDIAGVIIVVLSPDQRVSLINRKGAEILGHPVKDIIRKNWFDTFIPAGDRQKLKLYFERVVSGDLEPIEYYENPVLTRKGEVRIIAWHNTLLKDQVGQVISTLSSGEDITERKRAEEQLRKAHQELEGRVKERTAELTETNVRLRQEIAERKKAEEELRRLSVMILDAHEEERKRIGQELHDGVAQTISAIKIWVEAAHMQLGKGNLTESAKSLGTAVPLTQGAVEEVRRISRNLWPSTLDDLGILATISWLCKELEITYPGIRFENEIQLEENDVPVPLKVVIFRIIQEAFNNVCKHSEADFALAVLKKTNGEIELTINDNGKGFDAGRVFSSEMGSGGLGLASMRERAELSGGAFSIESEKGTGTTARVAWAVDRNLKMGQGWKARS